ncbi:MAG: iron ABC transporter permease [Alphaproteobacteria bacterium]|nr:ABC transporter permease [Rhodobiaceae bacterium]MBO6544204.1 iron ABC transporter permease [Alphaproteobacteria bacterium]MBO6627682.1 iron ABC transporter permease [Alphaproteobacteria bacterium]
MVAALFLGYAPLSLGNVLSALVGQGDERYVFIVQEIRLPRILLGAMVGGSLGMAGAALQGLLRNPLADPSVIGISSSAGLGAVIAIYYGLAAASAIIIPAFAIAFAFAAMLVLVWLAGRDASILTLILAGVAISSFAAALTSLAMNLSPNPFSLNDIILWLLGSLANRSFTEFWLAGPFMVAGWGALYLARKSLPALSLGEEAAASLGVDLRKLRLLVIFGAALSVGGGVAVSGAIGFVGLVAPHLVRPFVAHDPGRLLLPSALAGALLLVVADIGVRIMPGETELKLGVVTALLGAPFFLWLIIHTRRSMR